MAQVKKELYLKAQAQNSKFADYLINPLIQNFLQDYFEINLGGKKFPAPYFINTKKRKDLRALVGKGTPEEIVLETKVWSQVKKINLKRASVEEIRELMSKIGIGIDCSGLVVHSLDLYMRETRQKNLFRLLKYSNYSLRSRLARLLRPIENVSANELTSESNCLRVDMHDVRPGDLLRAKSPRINGYHVAIVTEVETQLDESNKEVVKRIEYVHSHAGYGAENGVRRGEIVVTDQSADLLKQSWTDVHSDGRNYLWEEVSNNYEDNGFRRLKFLA